ncbi:acyltransferase [Arthrobacter sp. KBS0703]|uniref:acyltransferase family protein n=1 Tax=Arthrobacter sp. KBS0703 TaxID=1955698 RepID=UPI00098ECFB6|nr:acyltransferase family protein [Arthrobacter sp. KBS0703]TSE14730.1 acyltransferase [Arthrobacter sp. KBS0703]
MTLTKSQRERVTPKRASPPPFRRDIQGLRMLAVVAVILDHLFGWPSGGFVGVDVFFVISGFLITGLLVREHEKTGSISFMGFYRNRIRRIAPAATLVLLATVIASWLLFNSSRFYSTLADSVWAFFFAANWHYAASGTNYFEASGPESPLQHFWSLAVEEQFYFVWPWLMLGTFLLGRRNGWSKATARKAVGITLAALTITTFAWASVETATNPTWAYFSTFSRAWELGIGGLIAVYAGALSRLPFAIRPALGYLGLGGICASLFVISDTVAFPAPWAALPVISTAAVIVAGTGGHLSLGVLTNPISQYIGKISYSLYLWHFPVIILYSAVFETTWLQQVICAAIFTLAAIYSFHLVEDPIRRSTWLTPARNKQRNSSGAPSFSYQLTALSLLALVTSATVALALVPPTPQQNAAAAPTTVELPPVAGTKATVADSPPKLASLQAAIKTSLAAAAWPELSPTLEEVIAGPQAPEDIMPCGLHKVEESSCTWGDPNAKHTIVTVGSSISMTYVAALRSAIGTDSDWNLVSYGMFGCPFGGAADVAKIKPMPEGCQGRAEEAVSAINRIDPDVIVFSGIFASADEEIQKITAAPQLVFMPGPPVDKDIASCYTKVSHPSDCVSTVPATWGTEEKIIAPTWEKGVFIDTLPWFCADQACPSFVGSTPTKLDQAHMTAAYAERLGPVIREALERQGVLKP